MNFGDVVNGLFELFGAVAVWMNVARVRKHKCVRGVYGLASAFFFAWGMFNLWYYPSLGQWASFTGGIFICAGNAAWLFYFVKYRRN